MAEVPAEKHLGRNGVELLQNARLVVRCARGHNDERRHRPAEFECGPKQSNPLDVIERLEHRTGRHYPRLAEFVYFNEAGIRVRTLIQPEVGRDLTRVALVANH